MTPLSLPKTYLLRKKFEYDKVYLHGKRVYGENFSLILLPNNLAHNRLGISIHGQLKGAVKRNRIKRIIRDFFRLNKSFLQGKDTERQKLPPMDIVVTIRKGFTLERPTDFAGAVSNLLNKKGQSLFQ